MFGSSVLEVAIGVVFIYLLLSLVCTVVNEAIATFVNQRGKNLFEGVKNLLNDPTFTGLAQQIYSHGLVDGISRGASEEGQPNRLPSYMPAKTFALALLDILRARGIVAGEDEKSLTEAIRQAEENHRRAQEAAKNTPADQALAQAADAAKALWDELQHRLAAVRLNREPAPPTDKVVTWRGKIDTAVAITRELERALQAGRILAAHYPDPLGNVEKAVGTLPDGHTKESLLVLIDKTRHEAALVAGQVQNVEHAMERLRQNLEDWYDDAMDRIGGWYKRWTQKISLAVALAAVLIVNADTLMMVRRFSQDNALRASIVTVAESSVRSGDPSDPEVRRALLAEAEKASLPLGWSAPQTESDPAVRAAIERALRPPLDDWQGWISKVVGLLISWFAVSLGAPFWFDTLSKFVNLRGAGTPPGETRKSAPQPAPRAP